MFDFILSRVIIPKYISASQVLNFLDVEVIENSIRLRIITETKEIVNELFKSVFPRNNSKLSSSQLNDKALLKLKEYINNNKGEIVFHDNCGNYETIIDNCIQNYHKSLRRVEVLRRMEKVFEGISELKDGWYNGEGTRFKIKDLNKVINLITELIRKDIPEPNIYPTVTNGIQLEWTIPPKEFSYEIDLNTEMGTLSILNTSNDEHIFEEISILERDKVVKILQDNMGGVTGANMP